jgi:hypothetical protein
MSCIGIVIAAPSIASRYHKALDQQRGRLVVTAQSCARLIEAVARFDPVQSAADVPWGAEAAKLSEPRGDSWCFQQFVRTVCEPLMVLERDPTVLLANDAFCRTFCDHRANVEGHRFYGNGDGQWAIPRLRADCWTRS